MREDKDIERLRRTTQQFAGTIGRWGVSLFFLIYVMPELFFDVGAVAGAIAALSSLLVFPWLPMISKRYFELERWDSAALFAGLVGMVVSVVWWIG